MYDNDGGCDCLVFSTDISYRYTNGDNGIRTQITPTGPTNRRCPEILKICASRFYDWHLKGNSGDHG